MPGAFWEKSNAARRDASTVVGSHAFATGCQSPTLRIVDL
jgi:hypothetical protein